MNKPLLAGKGTGTMGLWACGPKPHNRIHNLCLGKTLVAGDGWAEKDQDRIGSSVCAFYVLSILP